MCIVEGCERTDNFGRGLCGPHYKRWWRHGDPLAGATGPQACRPYLEKLLLVETDECQADWPFHVVDGYPAAVIGGQRWHLNRYVCQRVHGEPPTPEHQAAHSCGNRKCLNPRHLRWATNAENQADRLLHQTDLRGEQCPWAKLTDDDVRTIRRLRDEGLTCKVVAERMGVHVMTVSNIHRRKSWAHVE